MKHLIIFFVAICLVKGEELLDEVEYEESEDRAGGKCTYGYVDHKFLPKDWGKVDSKCDGDNQSPIALKKAKTMSKSCAPFTFTGYNEELEDVEVTNNGHTVAFTFSNDAKISGGCLDTDYKLAQFHFHWAKKGGSEHTIDKKRYSMELHLVHYSDAYSDLTEAVGSGASDALAVLGIMVEVEKKEGDNKYGGFPYNKISGLLNKITKSGKKMSVTKKDLTLKLEELLPDKKNFYRYMGSLTTPTCNEIVVWTVFDDPKIMRESQLNKFRLDLKDCKGNKMMKNFRPLQKLNGRTVYYVKE